MKNNFKKKLIEIARWVNIEIEENNAAKYEQYRNEIEIWNKKVNLTSVKDEEEFMVKHIIDSLMVLKMIEIPFGVKIIDIGTGAGFPGIPIKISRRDLEIYLLDSNKKKTIFLENTIKNLGLKETYVLCGRAENYGKNMQFREKYDYAFARAVSALNVLLELCLPFVKLGGFFVALKGKEPEEEIVQSRGVFEILGGRLEDVIYYELPIGIKRSLVVVEKVGKTPIEYPRREGIPEKKPLFMK
ncbi:16S rRNA (guanine527-N7)-methyltransferase [Caldanaerovirga acetigignens]|uniref:Ribosomal RNA small subunit methyltransferase G n=1 Tax=Caldanaerovirga acetigignens TaxID=447595 RepID=A0A1M7GPI0_9FIRM|nr:16S rRNA (guanine(527)-N(7))-methyltransferase RsmG [Caldanaerovirga acetigignens]SHM18304.1 16S rRNA (guanine527-N7)-methyltransferase [Caldanaerovirga acetigignens]